MKRDIYDVAVIGGGPGGYTAALYCARSGLSVLVLEKMSPAAASGKAFDRPVLSSAGTRP